LLFLLLAPLCFASFSLGIRAAQRSEAGLYAVGATNYCVAALVYAALFLARPAPLDTTVVCLGLSVGVLYAVGFFLIVPTMRDRGVSLVAAVMQLSVVVPIGASVLVWNEAPTPVKGLGAALSLIALPLLALGQGASGGRPTRRGVMLLLGLLVVNGLCLTAAKWLSELGVPEQVRGFFLILFGTASIVSGAAWLCLRHTMARRDLMWGSVVGISNSGAGLMTVLALSSLPGYVVFPVVQALSLTFIVAFAAVAWREVPGRAGAVGIALAIIAAALANA